MRLVGTLYHVGFDGDVYRSEPTHGRQRSSSLSTRALSRCSDTAKLTLDAFAMRFVTKSATWRGFLRAQNTPLEIRADQDSAQTAADLSGTHPSLPGLFICGSPAYGRTHRTFGNMRISHTLPRVIMNSEMIGSNVNAYLHERLRRTTPCLNITVECFEPSSAPRGLRDASVGGSRHRIPM